MDKEKLYDKLAKLIAFKEDAEKRDSKAELENVVARINELVLQYNLDESKAKKKEKNTIGYIEFFYEDFQKKNKGRWLMDLIGILSFNFMSKALFYQYQRKVVVIGEEVNIKTVGILFNHIKHQAESIANKAWKEYNDLSPMSRITIYHKHDYKRNTFLRDYLAGISMGIGSKLQEEKRSQTTETTALVRVKSEEVEKFVEENYNVSDKAVNTTRKMQGSAGKHGYIAGKNMPLNKPLENQGQKSSQLGEKS